MKRFDGEFALSKQAVRFLCIGGGITFYSLSCGRAHPSGLRVNPDLMQIEVRLTVSP
jgi:hypothetical protein